MNLTVEGLDLIKTNFRRIADRFPQERERIHEYLGRNLLSRSRSRARSDTGRMRTSINVEATPDRLEVGATVDYAPFQHWGTKHVTADRFLTDPMEEQEHRLIGDYERQVGRFLESTWKDS